MDRLDRSLGDRGRRLARRVRPAVSRGFPAHVVRRRVLSADPRRGHTGDAVARREGSRAGTAIVAFADRPDARVDRDARTNRRALHGGVVLRASGVRGAVVDGRRPLLGKRYRQMALRGVIAPEKSALMAAAGSPASVRWTWARANCRRTAASSAPRVRPADRTSPYRSSGSSLPLLQTTH